MSWVTTPMLGCLHHCRSKRNVLCLSLYTSCVTIILTSTRDTPFIDSFRLYSVPDLGSIPKKSFFKHPSAIVSIFFCVVMMASLEGVIRCHFLANFP